MAVNVFLIDAIPIHTFSSWSPTPGRTIDFDLKLSGGEQGKPLTTVLAGIEKVEPVRFYFLPAWLEGIVFDQDYKGQPLRLALDNLFLGTDLNYLEMETHAIVFVKDPTMAIQRINSINTAVKERKKIEDDSRPF